MNLDFLSGWNTANQRRAKRVHKKQEARSKKQEAREAVVMEELQPRCLLAATVTWTFATKTLSATGDSTKDNWIVAQKLGDGTIEIKVIDRQTNVQLARGTSSLDVNNHPDPVNLIQITGGPTEDDISIDHNVDSGGNPVPATISAGAGNDTIYGGDGHDSISGGAGNDEIWGDDSSAGTGDYLWGDDGNDTIYGMFGDDHIYGGANDDFLYGDWAIAHPGDDGNDEIWGEAGIDAIYGGAGNDALYGEGDNDMILGGTGDDIVDGGGGNDYLYGQDGNDDIHGGAGDDHIGNELDGYVDSISGGSGDDTLSNYDYGGPFDIVNADIEHYPIY